MTERPTRRMTLRELLTHSEKCARDLTSHVHNTMLPHVADIRDLSRPVRRKSHFPTRLAVMNALATLQASSDQTQELASYLLERMQEILDHARRERLNRY